MRRAVCRLAGVAAFVGLAVGCSSEPPLAQLSGTVKFKGEPVPAGYISFTPEVAAGGKGQVRVVQIRNGAFDSSKEPTPGIFPGPCVVRIAGFDGKGVKFWPQGKQIFNPVELKDTVPAGATTKEFVVPESAGKNVKIEPTADE
ncbi:MAG: hypothetical protein U0871_08050 [Gemmataceae bacterium]|jgi:hypothetical protein